MIKYPVPFSKLEGHRQESQIGDSGVCMYNRYEMVKHVCYNVDRSRRALFGWFSLRLEDHYVA